MNNIKEYTANEISSSNAQTQALVGRQGQEVQAAVFMAKQFPRNLSQSFNRVIEICGRESLAEVATYEYPRGGKKVTGPSIRLAEAIAQVWGNIDTGIIELERGNGQSVAMAYAWDLETNYRQTKTFTVPHIRETKRGSVALTDSRDIYEMVANQGARRQRACILGVLPGDIVETAIQACERTLVGNGEPLQNKISKMIDVFNNEFGVTVEMLEDKFGMNVEAFTEKTVITLRNIYTSLRDGMANVDAFFDISLKKEIASKSEPQPTQVDISALEEQKGVSNESV